MELGRARHGEARLSEVAMLILVFFLKSAFLTQFQAPTISSRNGHGYAEVWLRLVFTSKPSQVPSKALAVRPRQRLDSQQLPLLGLHSFVRLSEALLG